ncbi:MAG: hypothetical protein J5589_09850 [Firmicutes bacterium]|nr:hypothetical protein [Bacillota bacterium]
MNGIELMKLFYSKRKLRELVLILQLVIMAMFFASTADVLITYFQERLQMDRCYRIDYSRTVYFTPNMNLVMDEMGDLRADVYKKICFAAEGEKICRFADVLAKYEQSGTKNCKLLIYDHMDEILSLSLQKGIVTREEGKHYVVVTAGIGKDYPVGSEIEITFGNPGSTYDHKVRCIVSGILRENCAIPIPRGDRFVTLIASDALEELTSGQERYEAILSFDLGDEFDEEIRWEPIYLIPLKPETGFEEIRQKIEAQAGTYGTVLNMKEMMNTIFTAMIADNSGFIFLLVLYTLVALFGYGGYVFLTIETKKNVFRELYLLGATVPKIYLLYVASNFLLIVISSAIGMLTKSLANGIWPHMKFVVGSWEAFTVLLCMMTAILLLSSLIGFQYIRKSMIAGRRAEEGE